MYYTRRPMVIFINLFSFVWFIAIQYFRFKETGRACSGDFVNVGVAKYLNRKGSDAITATKEEQKYLLADQGFWFLIFVVAQYALYILTKVSTIIINNKLEAEFD